MKIRKFRVDDARKTSYVIIKTVKETMSSYYPSSVIRKVVIDNTPSRLIEKSKTRDIYVAVEGGEILGSISIERDTIRSFFVLPEHQGKGIGRKLIGHIEKISKRNNVKILKAPTSINSVTFYKNMGYRRIKSYTDKIHGKTILMEKEI